MQGEWDVEAHIMGDNGQWAATPIPKETAIYPIFEGTAHRETMKIAYGDMVVSLFFSWSYDQYRQVYRMISCDDQSGLMSVLEGNFIEGTDTVVIDDVRAGTSMVEAEGEASFSQLSSSKTSEDSFTDILSESYDKGHTWNPIFRAVHTRKKLSKNN
ncbi:hypothetical protein DKT75_01560 [Leucothrix arctica]|uniref:DUF1579 domain-containing protein n=2 Tax=Leucothrix arctica TaxID=1481894 RepID=A0A317CS43_9GAMM|nr:hypothetical protein DKT75_01560 [Leucothrix arctica]